MRYQTRTSAELAFGRVPEDFGKRPAGFGAERAPVENMSGACVTLVLVFCFRPEHIDGRMHRIAFVVPDQPCVPVIGFAASIELSGV